MSDHSAVISLGSNLGNRLEMLKKAIAVLASSGLSITAKSRVWETKPWGVADQPLFLNMCITARTDRMPMLLLSLLKGTELQLGRSVSRRWGPREIDIDIIFYDSLIFNDPKLQIPHPHMHERAFVLGPLMEIAPDAVHPVSGLSVRKLWEALPAEDKDGMTWISEL